MKKSRVLVLGIVAMIFLAGCGANKPAESGQTVKEGDYSTAPGGAQQSK